MKKITPPTLILLCLVGMIVLDRMVPLRSMTSWILLISGMGFMALGIVMGIGAESQFRQSSTTVDPSGMPRILVTDGWFRNSRNPMYLSFVVVLVGAWLALGSISPVLGILIYILLTERWYIIPEEKRLIGAFGNQYEDYRRQTRRWL